MKKSVADFAEENETRAIEFVTPVKGHEFCHKDPLIDFIRQYATVGFQATNMCIAIDEIRSMLNKKPLFDIKITNNSTEETTDSVNKAKSKIFFGCTSNMISSGLRDTICYLAKNKMFDVFVTTAGGIEEDIIKCLKDTYLAAFNIDGKTLRKNGYNRIGNLVIGNENYCEFEKWLKNLLDHILQVHKSKYQFYRCECCTNELKSVSDYLILTPSSLIRLLGSEIKEGSSILYWCAVNDIKVYCPALTDGSLGDILTFYYNRDKIKLDIVKDIHNLNMESVYQKRTGAIILGSGVVKHSILNANLFKNGADNCVLINNSGEFDGSDAGATLDEAVSWGKSKGSGVKVFGDASIIFPLIVAAAFQQE